MWRHLGIVVASLEQICDLDRKTKAMVQSHDDRVHAVFETASALHQVLTGSQAFTDLCDSLWDSNALAAAGLRDIKEIIGAYPLEDRYDIIAQHVVNNVGELPDYYTTSKFWNRNRTALMGTLDEPEIHPHHEALVQAGRRLEAAAQALLRGLKDLRLRLSLEHDVPYVVGSPASALA